MTKISFSLSEKSIDKAIKELKRYQAWVDAKKKLLIEKLSVAGAKEASVRFASALYDGDNDVQVDVSPSANGWVITAKGQAVAFIEFGAGVYYNPGEPYPNQRPPGVVGIGEYGKGYGKRRGWKYQDDNDQLVFTRGNPAAMPMWYATEEMRREIYKIAKEVFST